MLYLEIASCNVSIYRGYKPSEVALACLYLADDRFRIPSDLNQLVDHETVQRCKQQIQVAHDAYNKSQNAWRNLSEKSLELHFHYDGLDTGFAQTDYVLDDSYYNSDLPPQLTKKDKEFLTR